MPDTTLPQPHCYCGRLADVPCLSDQTTCGHSACEEHALGWGPIELRDEGASGWRHYLRGEPVHCGTSLLLSVGATKVNGDSVNAYGVRCTLADGHAYIHVRYESPLAIMRPGEEPPALLYLLVGPYSAVITASSSMRLRWPHRGLL